MSQFAAAGKTQPPWARAAVGPGTALTQGPGPAATSALGASLLGAQATAHGHVAAASAAAAGQTLTATGVHASPNLAAAAAAVAAAQSQQAATANSAAAAAAAYGTSLTLGLTQNALQPGAVISQSGIAIPASLAPTAPVGTPGIALPTTLATTQVATVTYPAPRLIAQATQFQPPHPQHAVPQQQPPPPQQQLQQPIKQRFFTGTVTKLHDNFGFVDEDVFFQLGVVKGAMPKVGERVLVEASYNPTMPFKWNGTRIQVLPNQLNVQQPPSSNARATLCSSMQGGQPIITTAGIPHGLAQQVAPGMNSMTTAANSNQGQYGSIVNSSGNRLGPMMAPRRHPSPPPPMRREREREPRSSREERRDRERYREREYERERYASPPPRKRSRSPRRRSQSPPQRRRSQSPPARRRSSNSPPRRRPRMVSRYMVQIPKVSLDMREGHVLEFRKRYANLYLPSDFFHASIHWQEAFPPNRPFSLDHPCSFHIMHKDVDPLADKDALSEPSDVDHSFSAKVMLITTPPLGEIYHKACSLAEDPEEVRENFVHPTRLISFLVGVKGKNETVAIGGPWSPSLDGPDPVNDPQVLIRTAIRTCKALTGIDLSCCSHWYRFAEIYYRRGESTHKGRTMPARVETVVLFLPDVWSCMPTQMEWDALCLHYKKQLQQKITPSEPPTAATTAATTTTATTPTATAPQQQAPTEAEDAPMTTTQEEVENQAQVEEEQANKNEPTHHSELDPKTMTVGDLRRELESRNLSSKGLKSQLIARLTKCLKAESDKESEREAAAEQPSDEAGPPEQEDAPKQDAENEPEPDEKRRKENDANAAEDERRVGRDAREKQVLTRRYNLPAIPSIVVHPSRTAKNGKFDCTVMSLSVLLDYRQEDNKEHSFEVSLFAELFNEMLMRDFGFNVYQAFVELEEKDDDKKKRKEKDDKDERRGKKDDADDDTERDDDETDEGPEEDDKDKKRKAGRKDRNGQMYTFDPHLLLSFVYFDQNHCGYILEKDLEDMIFVLGLHLSRAQVRRLLQKVVRRDTFHYRKITDRAANSATTVDNGVSATPETRTSTDELAAGNKKLLPVFRDKSVIENGSDDKALLLHQGAIVDVDKLTKQLERSEKARALAEQKLKKLQEEMASVSNVASEREVKIHKLCSEVEEQKQRLKMSAESLQESQNKTDALTRALQSCREQLQGTVRAVEKALEENKT